jgi:uncharacterized protein (DUF885 family)
MNRFVSVLFCLVLVGCASSVGPAQKGDSRKDDEINAFFDAAFDEMADKSPEFLTQLGIKRHYGKLDMRTEKRAQEVHLWNKKKLEELLKFKRSELSTQVQLSFDLFKKSLEENIADFRFRNYGYSVTQMYGIHSNLPAFMMTMHRVDNEQDLRDYLSRIEEFRRVFRETIDGLRASEEEGVVPPRFVFPYVISASENVIKGKPFTSMGGDSPLLMDFKKKLASLKMPAVKNKYFTARAEKALLENVEPAYKEFIAFFKEQEKRATTKDGIWKFPKGKEYYKTQLERYTTTSMSAEDIHALGTKEVERIQSEMRAILTQIGYKGTLQAFFKELRTNSKYYYPNTAAGRKAYMNASMAFYKNISERTSEFFRLLPKAPFEIRAVEKFREDSAGVAFYEHPSEDGSRPGVYYVNLKEMKNLPKHEAEVILYHEGAPGHHFQIALAQELQGVPKFRRFGNYTAYAEGWGLYTETLAKEMGAYKDPMSEFGKLAAEILRAARLVVDTGLHHKQWTREDAIKYMAENCPGPLDDQKNEVERYIVMPGQATAYKVGMLKILELRENAKKELGPLFDIRDFHDVVLGNGAVPLSELEKLVLNYIQAKQK